ncbi:hypothetical protein [Bacillus altitudinis]
MDEEQKQKIADHTLDLVKSKELNSKKLFLNCLGLFKLSTSRKVFLIFLLMASFLFLKYFIYKVANAIDIILEITANVNVVIIPVFAIVVTAYAIFQALANDQTMITLITVDHQNQGSKFKAYNFYFFGVGVFYLFIIILNFVLILIFKFMPSTWYIVFLGKDINEFLSAFFTSVYVIIIINFLIEMKSVIYNLFQVFVTHAASNAIKYLNESDQNNESPIESQKYNENKKKKNKKKKNKKR